ncbi:MAG: KH domain-containing protein [Candidatus Saccharibacteria bacterium]|nr:KH domain-containing protein [Candidatus Saccharibacteria bacterium]
MSTIDQQFVEYIVKTLVNNPDKVNIDRNIDEKGVLLALSVDPEDVGRVIGKRGATAQSIRTLLRALGTKNDARYNLKIVNSDGERISGERPEHIETAPADYEHTEPTAVRTAEDIDADEDATDEGEEEAETSELAEKTRAELADLDDLDI